MEPTSGSLTRRDARLRAFELLDRGKDLILPEYPLFLAITFVGYLIARFVPFGILTGPFMCGIFLAYKARSRGEKVEFRQLADGFQHFVESLIASLILIAVTVALMLPLSGFLAAAIVILENVRIDRDAREITQILAAVGFAGMALAVVVLVASASLFVYPLIADRKLSGIEALRQSATAFFEHPGDVLRVVLLNGLLYVLSAICCCLGMYLLLPFLFASVWLAYRELFPDLDAPVTTPAPAGSQT